MLIETFDWRWWLAGLLLLLVAIEAYLRSQPIYRAARHIPGVFVWPLIANSLEGLKLINNELSFKHVVGMANRFKCGYRFILGNKLQYWPTLAHEVEFLFNSSKNSDKSSYYRFLLPVLGEGLLLSNGAKWAHRRKILTPAFHFNILQKFLDTFKEESDLFVRQLADEECDRPDGIETREIISRFTLNNICETAMGVKLSSHAEPDTYRDMIKRSAVLLLQRFVNPIIHPDWVFVRTSMYREVQACARVQHAFSGSVIEQRRRAYRTKFQLPMPKPSTANRYEKSRYAMLDTLLEAEAAGQIDGVGIQEEVDTFMFEGYDTTSAALDFCLFTVGSYAQHQQRMYEEIVAVIAQNGGSTDLTVGQYSQLQFMDLMIKETLRLYPAVPYLSRQLVEPVDLGHVVLPRGTQVHVHIYNLHRDAGQFPEPDRFDPYRFLPETAERRHPFAYIPFSAGTRNCIGQKFAMLEIKCLLARLLLEYRLESVTRVEDLTFVSDLALHTKHAIRVRFHRRNASAIQ